MQSIEDVDVDLEQYEDKSSIFKVLLTITKEMCFRDKGNVGISRKIMKSNILSTALLASKLSEQVIYSDRHLMNCKIPFNILIVSYRLCPDLLDMR